MAEVFANFLLLVSMLIKLDLPTLERPIKAYSGAWVEGHFPTEELLITNSADLISMSVCIFCWQIYAFYLAFGYLCTNLCILIVDESTISFSIIRKGRK